jgi:hypothetical protein
MRVDAGQVRAQSLKSLAFTGSFLSRVFRRVSQVLPIVWIKMTSFSEPDGNGKVLVCHGLIKNLMEA